MIYINDIKINQAKVCGKGVSHDWEAIGYSGEPQFINDGYNYALEIQKKWNEEKQERIFGFFVNDSKVVFIPKLDSSGVSNIFSFFSGCNNALYMDFFDCTNIELLDHPFSDCTSLREIKLINTENTELRSLFEGCLNIEKINPISLNKTRRINIQSPVLREMTLSDICKTNKSYFTLDTSVCENWGVNNDSYPNAKDSVRNTLNNLNQGDRNNDLYIHPCSLSFLTRDEKKAISTKKYTINGSDYNTLRDENLLTYKNDITVNNFGLNIYNLNKERKSINIVNDIIDEYISVISRENITKIIFPGAITELIHFPKSLRLTDISFLFNNCTLLKSVDLSDMDIHSVTSSSDVFRNCDKLSTLILNNSSCEKIRFFADILAAENLSQQVTIVSNTLCRFTKWEIDNNPNNAICSGVNSYLKAVEYESNDYGKTWTPTGAEKAGVLLQENVNTCGGTSVPYGENDTISFEYFGVMPPTPFKYKVNSTIYTATESPFSIKLSDIGVTTPVNFFSINDYGINDSTENRLTKLTKIPSSIKYDKLAYKSTIEKIDMSYALLNNDTQSLTNSFFQCHSLVEANLSNLDMTKSGRRPNSASLFNSCENLTTVYLDNAKLPIIGSYYNIFTNCKALKTIYARYCDANTIAVIKKWVEDSRLPEGQVTIITEDKPIISPDDINFDFSGESTTFKLNNKNTYTATTSPYVATLASLGETLSVSTYFNTFENNSQLTKVNNLPNDGTAYAFLSTFKNCVNLKEVNLSHARELAFAAMDSLFEGCSSLAIIDFGAVKQSKSPIFQATNTFTGCTSLKTILMKGAAQVMIDRIKKALTDSGIPEGQVTIVTA